MGNQLADLRIPPEIRDRCHVIQEAKGSPTMMRQRVDEIAVNLARRRPREKHRKYGPRTHGSTNGGKGMSQFCPFWEGTTRNYPLPGAYIRPAPLVKSIRGKLAHQVEDNVVLYLEEVVLMTSPGTESSNTPLPLVKQPGNAYSTVARACLYRFIFI